VHSRVLISMALNILNYYWMREMKAVIITLICYNSIIQVYSVRNSFTPFYNNQLILEFETIMIFILLNFRFYLD